MAKKADLKHLLVIRLSAMGDVAMTVPTILELRKRHPNLKITVLTKPLFGAIFKSIDGVSIVEANVKKRHKGVLGLWRLFGELQKHEITHIADLHDVLRSNILGLFFRFWGIPVAKLDKGRVEKKALTRQNDKIFKPLKTTVERYQDVFLDLGLKIHLPKGNFLEKKELTANTKPFFGEKSQKHIGIAPFAAYPSKTYRLDMIEEVINQLLLKVECQILLFGGGEQEKRRLKSFENKFSRGVKSLVGEVSFMEELGLISNLDLMLAMDSGNGHLAANYGIPVITVWGVTHPYAGFAPYGQPKNHSLVPDRGEYPLIPTSVYGNKYPEGYEDAINSIAPDEIVKRIVQVVTKND